MTLVLVAHGTRRAAARSTIGALTAAVRDRLPGVDVVLGHVDVQAPSLQTVMTKVRAARGRAVVVPVLLSTGFHVEVDIAAAVDASLDVVTPALGPDAVLVEILLDRWEQTHAGPCDTYVLAASGSSRAGARADVAVVARAAGARLGRPVGIGWIATGEPDVATAVGAASGRVGVLSYVLADGVFARRLATRAMAAGAVAVAAPLGSDDRIADLIVTRYRTVSG